jgi:hypothetical protein
MADAPASRILYMDSWDDRVLAVLGDVVLVSVGLTSHRVTSAVVAMVTGER